MLRYAKWLIILGIGLLASSSRAQNWRPIGPAGGDVISLAADPRDLDHLYLGTQDGHIFASRDRGSHWQLLGRIGAGQDDVVTAMIVDPRNSENIYASSWALNNDGGGVYRSSDSGHTWKLIGLDRETVRALAQAPSNPNILVAGAVSGVYRSTNSGKNWEKISPTNHQDLKNFDSVAIDPRDPDTIYAGTYHLPWKTTNGGRDWFPISKGMIDDSDVMSLVINPANPDNVFGTACSGIYHSSNGAANWTKYKGIPFVFRRTQLIRQDPKNPTTLYAGTTSGLWKTSDDGATWNRVTPLEWVVNAVVIDSRDTSHLTIGTERFGVQTSEDGGKTFRASNDGFNHEHILDVAVDGARPERALVVLTHDVQPFIVTRDGGSTWTPLGPGLKRIDMRRAYATPTGWWASLNKGGLVRYDETLGKWVAAGKLVAATPSPTAQRRVVKGRRQPVRPNVAAPRNATPMQLVVNDLAFSGQHWVAATSAGLYFSRDRGATWSLASSDSQVKEAVQSVLASEEGSIWAASKNNLLYSSDAGSSWNSRPLPFSGSGNLRLHRTDDSTLIATTNLGLYLSRDAGQTWQRSALTELQTQDVAGAGDAMVLSLQRRGLFISHDHAKSWKRIDHPLAEGYFPVLTSLRATPVIFAASATEGLYTLDLQTRSAGGATANTSAVLPRQK